MCCPMAHFLAMVFAGRQPHVLLHRGQLAAEELLPGIREDLLSHGAVPFDTGTMAWLGEYGWLPTWIPAYETVSATRPLLEHLVRERVRRLAGVTVQEGVRVTELRRDARHRQVICEDAITVETDLVIDASGRGSRLLHWLGQLGVPLSEPLAVDAHLLEQPAGATRRPRRPRCVPGLRPHLPPDGGAPAMLFSPRAILSACRAALHGMPDPVPRAAVLNALAEPRHAG
jgi:hypothetical protein